MGDTDTARPDWRLDTRAVHSGERARHGGRFTSTTTPIYRTATFIYDTAEELDAVFGGEAEGYVYSRLANPTVQALETAVAALEGTEHCVAFGTGMAALHAALLASGLATGDRIVAARDLYAATYTLLNAILNPLGVKTVFVDMHEPGALEAALAGARRGRSGRDGLQPAAARRRPAGARRRRARPRRRADRRRHLHPAAARLRRWRTASISSSTRRPSTSAATPTSRPASSMATAWPPPAGAGRPDARRAAGARTRPGCCCAA